MKKSSAEPPGGTVLATSRYPHDAAARSQDGAWPATGDRLGGIAVWRLRHKGGHAALRAHGALVVPD